MSVSSTVSQSVSSTVSQYHQQSVSSTQCQSVSSTQSQSVSSTVSQYHQQSVSSTANPECDSDLEDSKLIFSQDTQVMTHHRTPHLVTKGGSENTTIHHTWLHRVVQKTPPYTTLGYIGWFRKRHHTPHLVTKGGSENATINHTWLHRVVQKTPPTRTKCRQTRFQLPPPPPKLH